MAQVQELSDRSDFDALLEASKQQTIALLKHSIACPISARGQREFVGLEGTDDPPLYAVVVQYARELSNHIEDALGVRHETPQVILIKDGKAVHNVSHRAISTESLREAVAETRAEA